MGRRGQQRQTISAVYYAVCMFPKQAGLGAVRGLPQRREVPGRAGSGRGPRCWDTSVNMSLLKHENYGWRLDGDGDGCWGRGLCKWRCWTGGAVLRRVAPGEVKSPWTGPMLCGVAWRRVGAREPKLDWLFWISGFRNAPSLFRGAHGSIMPSGCWLYRPEQHGIHETGGRVPWPGR